jgi:adenylate cyclase
VGELDFRQRLAAILAADAAGYSRLMAADERGTVLALDAARVAFRRQIEAFGGRVIDMAGDSVLAVFELCSTAMSAALAVQDELEAAASQVLEERRMRFRIGVHLGEIIEKPDGTVYGDGVNIAARLQGLAEPGEVAASESVRIAVRGKVSAAFIDLGTQRVKNIAEPVRAYRVRAVAEDAGLAEAFECATSGKPSVAVLPFVNMSGDAEQEYFADGMTEDLIGELARHQALCVIARNSVFAYKGQAVRPQQLARELGVGYVVEGSVRKAADRVRVNVQLVDAQTGGHLWAQRYDRALADILELQDELTRHIAAALPSQVEIARLEQIKRKKPIDMGAYDCVLRAKLLHHRGSRTDNSTALQLLEHAIRLDPEYAPAYGWRACTLGQAMVRGYTQFTAAGEEAVLQDVLLGLAIDEHDIECLRILCEFRIEQKRLDEALALSDKLLRLNPGDPRLLAQRGEILSWRGQSDAGIDWIDQAMRLDPHAADSWAHLLGRALFGAGRHAEAIAAFKRVAAPRVSHQAYIVACCERLGDMPRAQAESRQVLAMKPDFRAGEFCGSLFYADAGLCASIRESLIRAGLPE